MISAVIKSNIKQQEIKDLVAAFHKLLEDALSKLQMQCRKGVYFSFDIGWYSGQNPLSVPKVICRQSLKSLLSPKI